MRRKLNSNPHANRGARTRTERRERVEEKRIAALEEKIQELREDMEVIKQALRELGLTADFDSLKTDAQK